MPILPAEPDMYPDNLWLDDIPRSDPDRCWWCLHTKPRQEKMVARILHRRKIPYYLPQVQHVHRTPGGRPVRSVHPLFGGYVFLHGDGCQRVEAMQGNHLANVLEVYDQGGLERDLRQIYQMLSSGMPVVPEPTPMPGSQVRILSGPLNGLVGTVVRRGDRDHFVALVRFLGSGATIALKDWQVELVRN